MNQLWLDNLDKVFGYAINHDPQNLERVVEPGGNCERDEKSRNSLTGFCSTRTNWHPVIRLSTTPLHRINES
jgi:hypothetical protein